MPLSHHRADRPEGMAPPRPSEWGLGRTALARWRERGAWAAAPAATAAVLLILGAGAAAAAGPFGVGLPEPAATGGGFLPGLFRAIAAWQSVFYQDLTATIRAMKTDGSAGLWLVAVSFLYGVLHAAGPGHGKAIVSAYVLANRETARNGAVLAMVSAFAQGLAAVALVAVAAILLGATSIAMTDAAAVFERGSFALVTALGAFLVWRKILLPALAAWHARWAPVTVIAGFGPMGPDADRPQRAGDGAPSAFAAAGLGHTAAGQHHVHDDDCGCGHAHAVAPDRAAGPLDWGKAWTTVLAVGLRPCTGALIVLVFALAQGLWWAGVAAAFAMALGTGITVAGLTLAAVGARGLALRLTGGGDRARAVHAFAEGAGAVVVLVFGMLMLGASLSG